jgi:hypothetical protein
MGRGRAKAKQTKVARELKYQSHDMDLDRLRQDLGTGETSGAAEEFNDYEDPYASGDDGEGAPRRR